MLPNKFIEAFPPIKDSLNDELDNSLRRLESIPDTFCGLTWLYGHDFLYMSPSVEDILGHSRSCFGENGLLFFQSITPHRIIPHVFGTLQNFITKLESHPLYVKSDLVSNVCGMLVDIKNVEVPLMHSSVFMDWRPGNPKSYLILGSWLDTRNLSEQEVNAITTQIREILLSVKDLYHRIEYRWPNTSEINVKISNRENEIISLLASGLNSKEIAKKLGITFHTVESHRKNLLLKYSAKNTVELIAKAKIK